MPNSTDFIKEFGNVSFNEMSFCDADNLAFCQMFYMPIEKVLTPGFDAPPVRFDEVAEKMFEFNGGKHVAVGLVLLKAISVKMMDMAHTRRFGEVLVTGAKAVFEINPAVQFDACTFLLPDGDVLVIFRGTDDSIIGWKEDLDIYAKKGIPSHQLAVDYLEEVASRFDGPIIVCGHSKGGNVAQYAALNVKKETRDRIKYLYNNDGPGFYNYDFIDTLAYRELLPRYRHFIPQSSLVGVLLAHDDDYTVIKSSRLTGPLQHDLSTWQVKGTTMVEKDSLTPLGKFNDKGFADVFFRISEEQGELLDRVAGDIIEGGGEYYLQSFAKNLIPAVKGAKAVWKNYDDETKSSFKEVFTGTAKLLVAAAKYVDAETIPAIKKKFSDLAAFATA